MYNNETLTVQQKEVKVLKSKHARAIMKERSRVQRMFILLMIALAACMIMVVYIVINNISSDKTIANYQDLVVSYEEERQNIAKQYESEISELKDEIAFMERTPTADLAVLRKVEQYQYVLDNGLSSDLVLYTDEQCKKWDINPHLVWAIVETESRYNPNVENTEGSSARGLGQIVIATARNMYENVLGHGAGSYSHKMAYDPFVNIQMMCALIGTGLQDNNTLEYAIKRYSGGVSGYLEHIQGVAATHGVTLTNDTCHYPQGS